MILYGTNFIKRQFANLRVTRALYIGEASIVYKSIPVRTIFNYSMKREEEREKRK